MMSTLSTVTATLLTIYLIGWAGEKLPQRTEPALQNLHLQMEREYNSSWSDALFSLLEPNYKRNCDTDMLGTTDHKIPTRKLPENPFPRPFLQEFQGMEDRNEHNKVWNRRQRFPNREFTRKNKLLESFVRDADVLFLLTSIFQVYWIYRMFVKKDSNKRTPTKDSRPPRFTHSPLLRIDPEYIADSYRIETEELAKTIEYLNRKCAEQEIELKRKHDVINTLRSAVQRLEDTNKWDLKKQCTADILDDLPLPSLSSIYKFQIPVEDSIFDDLPLNFCKGKGFMDAKLNDSFDWEF